MKQLVCTCMISFVACMSTPTAVGKEPTGMDAVRLMDEGKVDEAIQAFEKLAAKGDDKAMVQLGIYYYQGTGVKQDYPKAMDWFLQAFAKQNADAFVNLGVMHRDGLNVPKNTKIAYCVFLTTHMCGMGSESTQLRSNSCLRRTMDGLSKNDIKDCLSNYTLSYVKAYIEAKGKMEGIPDKYKPSKENPALRDLGWWLDSELDAIYGKPTEEEQRARQKRAEQREKEIADLKHTLVFQIRFAEGTEKLYRSHGMITNKGMEQGPISNEKLQKVEKQSVYENDVLIYSDRHRYITIENQNGETLVFEIDHPANPTPCDWGKWRKPAYILKDSIDKFTLIGGGEPRSRVSTLPADAPELRFKVVKK